MKPPHGDYPGRRVQMDLADPMLVAVATDDGVQDVPVRHVIGTYGGGATVPATGHGSWKLTLERAHIDGDWTAVRPDEVNINVRSLATVRWEE